MNEEQVAEIVHDLKTPLTAIALEAGLLADWIAHSDRTRGVRSIACIQHNVAFLDRLLHDLLDACALAHGQITLDRRPAELSVLLQHTIDRLPTSCQERVLLVAPRSLVIPIDEHRIARVVGNLLDNALKYTTSEIIVELTEDARNACISVLDAGPGIPPDERPHIFDRYRRANSAREQAGSGLGLFVSKRIVEAHGGEIGVECSRSGGSRFFLRLPR